VQSSTGGFNSALPAVDDCFQKCHAALPHVSAHWIPKVKKTQSLFLLLFASLSMNLDAFSGGFISVKGKSICDSAGAPILLRGINLGNWLVPEGYMFKMDSAVAPRMINGLLTELIGPGETRQFWKTFRSSYVARKDIHFIKSLGLNSVRIPFNARLFMPEEYDGLWSDQPFTYLDSAIAWCREEGLWVILDMHCAPGGQTGDNIDDSWGFPYLFTDVEAQDRVVEVWRRIAHRYAHETTVLGYDLLNEPIAHFFQTDTLNPRLEPLYRRMVTAIREVDRNHIVILGGAQWNTNFDVFGPPFDPAAVYTFHRYWCDTTQELIQKFIDYRTTYHVPIWLGESGENTDDWIDAFRRLLERNDIGWCFWPFKRLDAKRCVVSVSLPGEWSVIQEYDRRRGTSYGSIRVHRPDPSIVRRVLGEYLENIRFDQCHQNAGYIRALGCQIPVQNEAR
jgi:endoglucanase